ncbi:histidine phosphatase family protein [Clostridium sp.]|nr:histidine phosphatase family protein [Clostridium sp.]MDR3596741.1 histidine phosphatase family protein [Clostridium sp.]
MYSSDLIRAKQTAEIISKYFKITPIFRKELRVMKMKLKIMASL